MAGGVGRGRSADSDILTVEDKTGGRQDCRRGYEDEGNGGLVDEPG